MLKKVLILSPSPGFGGLIRQLLDDTGGFTPLLVNDAKQAMHLAQKEALALTILDADLGLNNFPDFIADLRKQAPQTRLIVVPAEEHPDNPQLAELEANAILPSPFYLPDLVTAIEQLFGPLVPQESANRKIYGKPTGPINLPDLSPMREPEPAPHWLQNVSQAARYLTRLSLESSSQAALITRGEQVWAYAGELPKQAADELADTFGYKANENNDADLAQFIHLNATHADYMVYATSLGGEYRLALVFDAQTPFSQMRAHVADLAKALAAEPETFTRSDVMQEVLAKQIGTARLQETLRPDKKKDDVVQPAKIENQIPPLPSGSSPGVSPRDQYLEGNLTDDPEDGMQGNELRYSFLLIPRLPKHQLIGDLAVRLGEWLPELCLAFAYKLDAQTVHPEFLVWAVTVRAAMTAESVVLNLQQYLSARIFDEFPRLARENPSGEFWAPGFLVVSGSQQVSAQINDFIQATRRRQGILPD